SPASAPPVGGRSARVVVGGGEFLTRGSRFAEPAADGVPDVGHAELRGPARDVVAVHLLAADFQDAGDVAQVLLGAAFVVVPQLGENDVVGSGGVAVAVREELDPLAAFQLFAAPGVRAGHHQIDFVPRGRVEHVELVA